MNKYFFPPDERFAATHTSVRVNPLLRCPCGHSLKAHDFDITDDGSIRLDCPRCFSRLFEIEQAQCS